ASTTSPSKTGLPLAAASSLAKASTLVGASLPRQCAFKRRTVASSASTSDSSAAPKRLPDCASAACAAARATSATAGNARLQAAQVIERSIAIPGASVARLIVLLVSLAVVPIISAYDPRYQLVAHDIDIGEIHRGDAFLALQRLERVGETR